MSSWDFMQQYNETRPDMQASQGMPDPAMAQQMNTQGRRSFPAPPTPDRAHGQSALHQQQVSELLKLPPEMLKGVRSHIKDAQEIAKDTGQMSQRDMVDLISKIRGTLELEKVRR